MKTAWTVHTLGAMVSSERVLVSSLAKDVLGRECKGLVKERHENKAITPEKKHAHTSLSPALAATAKRLYVCVRDAASPSLQWACYDGKEWTMPRAIDPEHCKSSYSPALAAL